MALDKLTLLDETIINTTATTVATNVVNNSAQTNYISFPVATSNPLTNGWRVYSDGASHSPVDGISGVGITANSTLTQNTTPPVLNSTGDFRLTKNSGASRQGEGISTDFTIASRHLGKLLQISFDYEIIGATTLATDDLRVYIIQNPSGTPVVIEPVNVGIQGTITGVRLRHIATFQTDISITSYRLCIHIKTTTNSAQTIDFNNFRVWEPTQTIGSIITDWQSYTPTIQGMTITSTDVRWRRVGSNMELQGNINYSATAGSEFRLSLPFGSVSSSITSTFARIGQFTINSSSSSSVRTFDLLGTANLSYLTSSHAGDYGVGTSPLSPQNTSSMIANTTGFLSLQASVPIQGWGSSVAMSSDSNEGRVVAARYYSAISTTTTRVTNTLAYQTRSYDTHGAYSTSTGKYTAPMSGIYRITGAEYFTSSNGSVDIYKNNSLWRAYATYSPSAYTGTYSDVIDLLAGETCELRVSGGTLTSSATLLSFFSIERISAGSQIMAQTETVVAVGIRTLGSITPGVIITWTSKEIDSHGALDISTGEFTCPIAGRYLVVGRIMESGGFTNAEYGVSLRKNGTQVAYSTLYINSGATIEHDTAITHIINCVAGDKISLFGYGSSTYTPSNGSINITRLGV